MYDVSDEMWGMDGWDGCEKRHFLRHLYLQCIILPRQARDKHRESTHSKKSGCVFRRYIPLFNASSRALKDVDKSLKVGGPSSAQTQVRKRLFLRHFYIKCIIVPRQARDKHRESTQKSDVFLQYVQDLIAVGERLSYTANCIIFDHFSAFESGLTLIAELSAVLFCKSQYAFSHQWVKTRAVGGTTVPFYAVELNTE